MKIETGFTRTELAAFAAGTAMFLEGGVPLSEAVKALSEENEALLPLADALSKTGSLSGAMEQDGRFTAYMTGMVKAGEKTGRLSEVLPALAKHYEREAELGEAVRTAAAYPATLLIMLLALLIILLWRVAPVFRRVLGSMGLSGGASPLMKAGSVLGAAVAIVSGVLLVFLAVLFVLYKTGHKDRVLKLVTAIPAVKRFVKKRNASRCAGVLSMMLSAGFAAEESAALLTGMGYGPEGKTGMDAAATALVSGGSVYEAAEKTGFFDAAELRLMRTAVQAGREADCLSRLAASEGEQAEEALSSFVSTLEPVLVAVLSVITGGVLLSVMLPMAGALENML